jgi:glycosyltransferase involved in cell wall biosynthesis
MPDLVPRTSRDDLPAPPPGSSGWPWTQAPDQPVDGQRAWPAISIVIPSLRQGDRIEAAIRSVLLQGYPRLELMVLDGGSTDGTCDILRRYAPWLSHWESRPDRGQSHAINKGWARSRGEVFNWLCCDDVLAPGALATVGAAFGDDPTLDVLAGSVQVIAEFPGGEDMVMRATPRTLDLMPEANPIGQPSCFIRRRAVARRLLVREGLRYSMDFDLWMHLKAAGTRWRCSDAILSIAHMTGDNKICRGGGGIVMEVVRVNLRYQRRPVPLALWYVLLRWPLDWLLIHADEPLLTRLLRPMQILYTALLVPFYGIERIKALNAWSGLEALRQSTRAWRRRGYIGAPRREKSRA